MQFVRTIGLAALAVAAPAAQAAIVTLAFDITPTTLGTGVWNNGVIDMTLGQPVAGTASFSLSVQIDTDMPYDVSSHAGSPTRYYAASRYFDETGTVVERPPYADAFNNSLPYTSSFAGIDLTRVIATDTATAVPYDTLVINAVVSGDATTSDTAIQNRRNLRLNLSAHPAYDPIAYTDLTPYLGDEAAAKLQALEGLTVANGFRETLTLVQRRLILGNDGSTWVVDNSNAGILSMQTISVTGDVRLRSVTVAVPEPATSILAGIGMVGLLAASRRRLKTA